MESQEPREEFPVVVRRERPRWKDWLLLWSGVVGGLLWMWREILHGLTGFHPLEEALLLLFGLLLTGIGLSWLYKGWKSRRWALQVDGEGVHELFADGRRRTLRWEEIGDLLREEETVPPSSRRRKISGWVLLPRSPAPPIVFDTRLEDAYVVASLIHARLHHLPLLPPHALSAPSAEDIQEFFRKPPPVLLLDVPALAALFFNGCAFSACCLSALGVPLDLFWLPLPFLLATGGAIIYLIARMDRGFRIKVDERGIELGGFLQAKAFLPWREVVGREGWRIKGLYFDLSLPMDFHEGEKVLEFVDALLERRSAEGGMRVLEKPSAAALMVVEPELAGEASPAALMEVAPKEKPRLTGKELEAREEEQVALHISSREGNPSLEKEER